MSRATFRQADVERILRAARREKAAVQIDIRSLIMTVTPIESAGSAGSAAPAPPGMAPDGEENWNAN